MFDLNVNHTRKDVLFHTLETKPFLFSCQSPWFHFVYFLFLSFQSIWLLSLCFPWLSPVSQYCLDSSSRQQLLSAVCVRACVCVLYHTHYNYLWVWVCHLLPAHVPNSHWVVWELHPDASAFTKTMGAENGKSSLQWMKTVYTKMLKKKKKKSVSPGRAKTSRFNSVCSCLLLKNARTSERRKLDVAQSPVNTQRYHKIDLVFNKQELATVGRHYKNTAVRQTDGNSISFHLITLGLV